MGERVDGRSAVGASIGLGLRFCIPDFTDVGRNIGGTGFEIIGRSVTVKGDDVGIIAFVVGGDGDGGHVGPGPLRPGGSCCLDVLFGVEWSRDS